MSMSSHTAYRGRSLIKVLGQPKAEPINDSEVREWLNMRNRNVKWSMISRETDELTL